MAHVVVETVTLGCHAFGFAKACERIRRQREPQLKDGHGRRTGFVTSFIYHVPAMLLQSQKHGTRPGESYGSGRAEARDRVQERCYALAKPSLATAFATFRTKAPAR
jgi:hypothetical protein